VVANWRSASQGLAMESGAERHSIHKT